MVARAEKWAWCVRDRRVTAGYARLALLAGRVRVECNKAWWGPIFARGCNAR